jgi:hypothetical protein
VNAKRLVCGVLLVGLATTTGAQGQSPPRRPGFQDHQVPAGTWLFLELRTPIASDTSQPSDAIRGVLKSPLTSDGVELVPSGAVVLGTVTEAAPALHRRDRARVAFRFHVLEHPTTGSRVSIRSETRVLEVEGGKKIKDAEGAAAFNQIRLKHGDDVSVSLREPFLVRIPEAAK